MYSKDYLQKLFLNRNRAVLARITSLSFQGELPLETLEGVITSGSVNIDGTSAVRRTCQLSFVTENVNVSDYLWGLQTKFLLEIGIIDGIETIWFKQGIYIITSFNSSLATNAYTMNISGKDKMCLLNGENGGTLPHEVDFGKYEEIDKNGNIRVIQQSLINIIRDAVHHYGGEDYVNIIINDLENRGLELQEYRYSTPMYLIRKAGSAQYFQGTLNGDLKVKVGHNEISISELPNYDILIGTDFIDVNSKGGTEFNYGGEICQALRISYGETLGYTSTEMVYAGELIANAGESITSVLDKIKTMLGNFEYFYDLDGRFIFQEQKNYINTAWSPLTTNEDSKAYLDPSSEKIQFSFEDGTLITAFNNTPNLANLKNDFSVFGTRKSESGAELKIHMRYAIDRKPVRYTTIEVSNEELIEYNKKYGLSTTGQESKIYVSSQPPSTIIYSQFNKNLRYAPDLASADDENKIINSVGEFNDVELELSKNVEEIYLFCDWRELIYQMAKDYRKYGHLDSFKRKVAAANPDLFPTGITGYEPYYVDMEGFWRTLYCYDLAEAAPGQAYYPDGHEWGYWNTNVNTAPEKLLFWFDLLDSYGELSQFEVSKIGMRSKVSNDKDVKAIYYKETPPIIFTTYESLSQETDSGYTYLNIPANIEGMFSQSSQGKTAKAAIDNLIYNHAYCAESVSVTCVPVYSLEPNIRIYIKDLEHGIDGEYIPTRFTVPLAYNGTMNITATKAVDRII